MDLSALRRAFRARPGTTHCDEFRAFLEGLETSELGWRSLVAILEKDVVPVVQRCHPTTESDEISSTCLTGAFEGWVSEWLDRSLVEGTRSARSHFISRTREQIHESERKRWRQSRLMTRHCSGALEMAEGSTCGIELDRSVIGEPNSWRISALPPAHLLSQDLAERLRRLFAAVDELGPEHARVFKLLLEGLSQRSIARIEGRDPACISRRVRNLRQLCRAQLLN